MQKSMRVVLFAIIAGLILPGTTVGASERIIIAQAGSTGGTIGKQGKSVSGSEEPRSPARDKDAQQPAKPNAAAILNLPNTILLKENSFAGTYTVTLRKLSGNVYGGTWNHGYVTKFTIIAFTKDSMKMERNDRPAFGSVSGIYIAQRVRNSAHGEATISNGINASWDASW